LLFRFVPAFFREKIHDPSVPQEFGSMHCADWNIVFVAFLADSWFTVYTQFHFAVDNHAPLWVNVIVVWQINAFFKLKKDKLIAFALHYPCSNSVEGNLCFWQPCDNIRVTCFCTISACQIANHNQISSEELK
jgi:hypothetical protein